MVLSRHLGHGIKGCQRILERWGLRHVGVILPCSWTPKGVMPGRSLSLVDDLLIICKSNERVTEIKDELKERFKVHDLVK
jgi:hypothetical protein